MKVLGEEYYNMCNVFVYIKKTVHKNIQQFLPFISKSANTGKYIWEARVVYINLLQISKIWQKQFPFFLPVL